MGYDRQRREKHSTLDSKRSCRMKICNLIRLSPSNSLNLFLPPLPRNLPPPHPPLHPLQPCLPLRPTLAIAQQPQLVPPLQKLGAARTQLRNLLCLLLLLLRQLRQPWAQLDQRGRRLCIRDGQVFQRVQP